MAYLEFNLEISRNISFTYFAKSRHLSSQDREDNEVTEGIQISVIGSAMFWKG